MYVTEEEVIKPKCIKNHQQVRKQSVQEREGEINVTIGTKESNPKTK